MTSKTLKVDRLEHRIVFDQAELLSFQADHGADKDHGHGALSVRRL